MPDWSPPSISQGWLVGIGLLSVAWLGYSLLILSQLLLGLLPGIVIGALYILWRFLVAVEAIADALQRIAHQREQE